MKTLFLFFCFACIFYYTFAAVAIERASKDKNHPGHCYTTTNNLGAFNNGEVKSIPGQCGTATCSNNGDIHYESCGAVGVAPPCVLDKGDLSKPYPKCCPQPRCP